VIVDYAHTDDALRNLLALQGPESDGRIITLFWLCGDRDRTSGPYGRSGGRASEIVVLSRTIPQRRPAPGSSMTSLLRAAHESETLCGVGPAKAIEMASTRRVPVTLFSSLAKAETYQCCANVRLSLTTAPWRELFYAIAVLAAIEERRFVVFWP